MRGPYERARCSQPSSEIRLLQVRRSETDDNIEGYLEVFPVHQCPEYTALSYTWRTYGSDENESSNQSRNENLSTIRLDNTGISVGLNLHRFLQRASSEDSNCRYWIDALCINQSDDLEKRSQIPLMKEIYTNASRVIVWLGQDDRIGDETINFIELSSESFNINSWLAASPRVQEGFISLCHHEYWSRVWIIQEVICARNLCIYSCDRVLRWEALAKVLKVFRSQRNSYYSWEIISSPAATIFQAKTDWTGNLPLHELIDTYSELSPSVEQDAVYGLMGLAEKSSTVAVNYSKPLDNVIEEVLIKACQLGYFADWRSALPIIQRLLSQGCSHRPVSQEMFEDFFIKAGMTTEWRRAPSLMSWLRCERSCGAKTFRCWADLARHLKRCQSATADDKF